MKPLYASIAILCLAASPASAVTDTWWNAASNNWSTSAAWTHGEPGASTNAYINNGGTAAINQSGEACYILLLGENGGDSGAVSMTSGGLSGCLQVGGAGSGVFTQSGGTVSADTTGCYVTVGTYVGGSGQYTLSGAGQLNAWDLEVGNYSAGSFTQSGGAVTVGNSLVLGRFNSGEGTYDLDGGSVDTPYLAVGEGGVGLLTVTGGAFDTGSMVAAWGGGVQGITHLDGGSLTVDTTVTGGSGTSRLFVDGGALSVGASIDLTTFAIGYKSGYTGSYTQPVGLAVTTTESYVGAMGGGHLTQNGGSHDATDFYIGNVSGASGQFDLSGGTVDVITLHLADGGQGWLNQNGGDLSADAVRIGMQSGASGVYNLFGGTLTVTGDVTDGSGSSALSIEGGLFTPGPNVSVTTFSVGQYANDTGDFTLPAGTTVSADTVQVGGSGTGTVVQNGGVCQAQSFLVGSIGGTGVYTLNDGDLAGVTETIGANGYGYVYHEGGLNQTFGLTLAEGVDSVGYYRIAGGQLTVLDDIAGGEGYSYLYIDGGTVGVTGDIANVYDLTLGNDSGSAGAHTVTAGHAVQSEYLYVGYAGQGDLTVQGGEVSAAQAQIGSDATGVGAVTLDGGSFVTGTLTVGLAGAATLDIVDPATHVEVSQYLEIGPEATIDAAPGSVIHMTGSIFANRSADPASAGGLANVSMIFEGGAGVIDSYEAAGEDRGARLEGFEDNFTMGALAIGGSDDGNVILDDNIDNTASADPEAVYLGEMIVNAGSVLDLNGLNVYVLEWPTLDGVVNESGGYWWHVVGLGDFNGDGALNGLDIPGFKAALSGGEEWSLANHRNADIVGDFDGNGVMNGLDIPGFKEALAGSAVPEPATMVLVAAGAIAVWRRKG